MEHRHQKSTIDIPWDAWDDRDVSIEQLPSGKYRAVVRHLGQKVASAAADTRAEAKMLEAQLKVSMGAAPLTTGHTVEDLVAGYIADVRLARSPATAGYYTTAAALIPPAFAARQVKDVTVYIVDQLYRELSQASVTLSNVVKLHRLLSAAFGRAVKYGWAAVNPCKGASKPSPIRSEIDPPTVAQVQDLIAESATVNPDLPVFLRLAAQTGGRRGELAALKWIDIADRKLTIRRSLVDDDGTLLVRDTKTHSRGHRSLTLDVRTAGELVDLRERQSGAAKEQLLPTPVWMFSHDAGVTPWRPEYITTAFQRLANTLSLNVRLHDLRHFSATQQLAAGVDVTTVSRRLGHAKVSMTLDTYSHWMPQRDKAAADVMGAIF